MKINFLKIIAWIFVASISYVFVRGFWYLNTHDFSIDYQNNCFKNNGVLILEKHLDIYGDYYTEQKCSFK